MTDVHVKNIMSYVWTKLIILHIPTSITYNVFSLLQMIYYAFIYSLLILSGAHNEERKKSGGAVYN